MSGNHCCMESQQANSPRHGAFSRTFPDICIRPLGAKQINQRAYLRGIKKIVSPWQVRIPAHVRTRFTGRRRRQTLGVPCARESFRSGAVSNTVHTTSRQVCRSADSPWTEPVLPKIAETNSPLSGKLRPNQCAQYTGLCIQRGRVAPDK